MNKVFEEIKKLHSSNLNEDLKIVISLVLSRHSMLISKEDGSSLSSLTPAHICMLHVFYADAWYASRQFKKAEKHYKEALGIWRSKSLGEPTERQCKVMSEVDVRYKLYMVYMEQHQTSSAIRVLEALNTKERTMAINMALGDLYRQEGMDRSAITCYKEVLRNCPLSVEAARNLLTLGMTRLNVDTLILNSMPLVNEENWLVEWLDLQQHVVDKNISASLNSAHHLNRVCPRNAVVLDTKADVYCKYGQYKQASLVWQEVLEVDPLVLRNTDKMAYVFLCWSDQANLAKLCSQLSTTNSTDPEPWVVHGFYSIITKKYTEAIYFSHKALMLDPRCYTAHVLKGSALTSTDRLSEAEQSFKEAMRLDPYRLEAYNECLKAYLSASRVKEAILLANTVVQMIGSTPSTLYFCGKALSAGTQQQQLKAKLYLEKAIEGDPSYLLPVYTLADILSKHGKHKKILQILEASLRNNNTSRLHQIYGDALSETGDRQRAMHHYGIALRLDSTNEKAKDGLERVERKPDISMDLSYEGDSVGHSSEVEMREEVDRLSWSDPEIGY
ncbi:anaphase-promoting complex subunit 7-like isoform X2 [Watersipora subatra]|uniref:anaphase-promoting complex subunit 7-like isoform X2 n=1 Tax=Watersipora subatra TaxID=2589382 RepID=UPI00355BA0BB